MPIVSIHTVCVPSFVPSFLSYLEKGKCVPFNEEIKIFWFLGNGIEPVGESNLGPKKS